LVVNIKGTRFYHVDMQSVGVNSAGTDCFPGVN
jgi:hypothetical protein